MKAFGGLACGMRIQSDTQLKFLAYCAAFYLRFGEMRRVRVA